MRWLTLSQIAILSVIALIATAQAPSREGTTMATLSITSSSFRHGEMIPARFTCDGADVNPPLTIDNVPPDAKSLALIVDDPDAPGGLWVHWVVWNIDPATREIAENTVPARALLGRNDFRQTSYGGACPPSGTHRYFFRLFALDAMLNLPAGAGKASLEKAMTPHILAQTTLMGKYRRQ